MNVSLYEISADFLKALDGLEVDEEGIRQFLEEF